MRFGISDLLVILSIVAACLAVASFIGHFNPDQPTDIEGLLIRMTIFAAGFFLWVIGPRKNGSYVTDKQTGLLLWPVREYVSLFALFVAFWLGNYYFGRKAEHLYDVLGTVGGVAIAATLSRHRRYPPELVAVVRNEAWRWEDATYDLIDYDGEKRLYPREQKLSKPAGSVLDWPIIPDSEAASIAAILAAKQEKEGTTDHTDAHG